MAVRPLTKWYGSGLSFECSRCGRCCSGPEEGYVWVASGEIERIAGHLGLSAEAFGAKYLRFVEGGYSLIEKPNKDCIFFEPDGGCAIYSVRPTQCRTFPFWQEHVRSRRAWRELARDCPGIDQGPRHSELEIERQVDQTDRVHGR